VINNIQIMDLEDLGNIVDKVLEDVNFEDAMDIESSDESVLSDDTGCISDLENNTNRVQKIVSEAQIRTLSSRMKYCQIQCYYSTGGALAVCVECMVNIADADVGAMFLIRKHDTDFMDIFEARTCTNCRKQMYQVYPCNVCPIFNESLDWLLDEDTGCDKNLFEDVKYVFENLQRENGSARTSPVHIIRDREIYSDRVVKRIIVDTEPTYEWSLLAPREVYTRLRNMCMNSENVTDDDYCWVGFLLYDFFLFRFTYIVN
ncbi:hypothetical protein ALC62_07793, partial [Cyphomyrmex costatus]